jgi:hypothetical protein
MIKPKCPFAGRVQDSAGGVDGMEEVEVIGADVVTVVLVVVAGGVSLGRFDRTMPLNRASQSFAL